jgi:hypothetical protein
VCSLMTLYALTLLWMVRMAKVSAAGSFQSREAQASCVSCDDLGAFYQEGVGQSACNACPSNTARFAGTTKSMNASACQCIIGASFFRGQCTARSCI